MAFLKAILALFLAFFSALNIFDKPSEKPPVREPEVYDFEYLEYPDEAIIQPGEAGLTFKSFLSRADDNV